MQSVFLSKHMHRAFVWPHSLTTGVCNGSIWNLKRSMVNRWAVSQLFCFFSIAVLFPFFVLACCVSWMRFACFHAVLVLPTPRAFVENCGKIKAIDKEHIYISIFRVYLPCHASPWLLPRANSAMLMAVASCRDLILLILLVNLAFYVTCPTITRMFKNITHDTVCELVFPVL